VDLYESQDTHKSLQVFQSSHATGVAQKKTYKVLQEGTMLFLREPGEKNTHNKMGTQTIASHKHSTPKTNTQFNIIIHQ